MGIRRSWAIVRERNRTVIGGVLAAFIAVLLLAGCSAGAEAEESASVPSTAAVTASAPASASDEAPESSVASPSAPSASDAVEAAPASPSSAPTPEASAPASTPEASAPPAMPSSAPSASASPSEPPVEEKPVFTISVVGIGDWGTIVNAEQVELKDGDTPASALKRVAKAHRLAYEIRGSGALTYIEGIDGLYEFDYGPTSGWKFSVNGVVSDIGAGVYKLKPGDRVEWYYVEIDELAESGSDSGEAQP